VGEILAPSAGEEVVRLNLKEMNILHQQLLQCAALLYSLIRSKAIVL